MKYFPVLLLASLLTMASCGNKGADPLKSSGVSEQNLLKIDSKNVDNELLEINSYEEHELKDGGLVIDKNYTFQNGVAGYELKFNMDVFNQKQRNTEKLTNLLSEFAKKIQSFLEKYKGHTINEKGEVVELKETIKTELTLKMELCQDVVKKLPPIASKQSQKNIEVESSGQYKIESGKLIILTNMNKDEIKTIDGTFYHCEIELDANTTVEISANERELNLSDKSSQETFKRLSDSTINRTNYIIGSFENIDEEIGEHKWITLKDDNVIIFKRKCSF